MTVQDKPTPHQVDDVCLRFDAAKSAEDAAGKTVSAVKGELLAMVQRHGYVPANAEKTIRLEGVLYIANATTGSSIEINESFVNQLQAELSRLKLPKVFAEMFDRQVKHQPRKDAKSTLELAIGSLPQKTQTGMLSLYASCFSVNPKAPSLSVELAAALRAKEAAAAEKAAKKAARAAKKGGK